MDLHIAFRSLFKSPGFAAVAILTIAVGIAANTTLFSIFNQLVLNPTTLPEPTTLVQLWARNSERNFFAPALSWPRYEDIRTQQEVFASVGASTFGSFNLSGNGDPEQLTGLFATSSFLPTLGITPAHGRHFTPDEDKSGASPVAILSHELWQSRFGGRDTIVGETILLSGTGYTVVGVLPPNLSAPYNNVQLIATRPNDNTALTPQQVANGAGFFQAVARLKPGVGLERAQAAMNTLAANYRAAYPERLDAQNETVVRELKEALVGNVRPTFHLLLGVVGFVLLIACANVSSLFLGRLSARQREIAVRLSLGATRRQMIRQFLLESLLFSSLAALLGVLLSLWALAAVGQLAANLLPPSFSLRLDLTTLAFTAGFAALTAVLVGFVPALQASRTDLSDVLKDAARGQPGGTRGARFRSGLVVAEVALSVVLLVGSGLLLASFIKLQRTPPGFDPQGVASAFVSLPLERYRTPARQAEFFSQVVERLKQNPLVTDAAAAVGLPLAGFAPQSPYSVRGRDILPLPQRPLAGLRVVTEDYFRTLRIPMREGRAFTAEDRENAPGVCIINESLAKRLFPGESAVGKVLLRGPNADIPGEIVGVIADVKSSGLAAPPPDEVYWPSAQLGRSLMALVARTSADPAALQAVLRSAVASVDAAQPIAFFTTMDNSLAQSLGFQRITATLTGFFAAVALVLAAVGLYSVLAYAVTQRTGEIGIRMALGAQKGQVISLILRQGMLLVGIGLAVGLAAAAAGANLMRSLLFSIEPLDPLVFSGVAVLFLIIAFFACLLPSLRASRVDPLVALRTD